MVRRVIAIAITAALLAAGLSVASAPDRVEALSGSEFDPGYIISDELFYKGDAMTEAQIQAFLDSRIGVCNNSNCLNVYRQTTEDRVPSERCPAGYKGATNESAARIIFKVQTSCNISAKVILVTLQKEQSLVTSKGPSLSTLERAMGYYCPDDPSRPGWCNPLFGGFFNQVLNASAQFQRYRLHPTSFNHRIGTQSVRYHPNSDCGSRTVAIRNAATAGLYNYTPYTPNQAALSNLFGVGDSCSAYGNRNFWRIYSEWFGSPTTLFSDVPATRAFFTEIEWLARSGIASGYSDGTFRPLEPVSRDAMAAFLYRYAGQPAFTPPAQSPFSDVTPAAPFYKEITWLHSTGVASGFRDGSFRPSQSIGRDAMAAFLYRFVEWRTGNPPVHTPPENSPFSDIVSSSPFYREITWLAGTGITGGYSDGTFRPVHAVNRDAMAAFLFRFARL